MEKSVAIALLVCVALMACEPRTPQKPKTIAVDAQVFALADAAPQRPAPATLPGVLVPAR